MGKRGRPSSGGVAKVAIKRAHQKLESAIEEISIAHALFESHPEYQEALYTLGESLSAYLLIIEGFYATVWGGVPVSWHTHHKAYPPSVT